MGGLGRREKESTDEGLLSLGRAGGMESAIVLTILSHHSRSSRLSEFVKLQYRVPTLESPMRWSLDLDKLESSQVVEGMYLARGTIHAFPRRVPTHLSGNYGAGWMTMTELWGQGWH